MIGVSVDGCFSKGDMSIDNIFKSCELNSVEQLRSCVRCLCVDDDIPRSCHACPCEFEFCTDVDLVYSPNSLLESAGEVLQGV